MLLLIDAGNSRIKWVVAEAVPQPALGGWKHAGVAGHQDALALGQIGLAYPITRILVSNVAGAAIQHQLAAILEKFQIEVEWLVSQPSLAGVRNRYRPPAQLGCDRFAAVIGARALFPDRDLVIATCGTATTIDALSADGDFTGGMILPGLEIMAQSLAQHTAQLPLVAPAPFMRAAFGDHTEAAMVGGCLAAQAGAIEYAVQHYGALGCSDAVPLQLPLCVLAGGAAAFVAASLHIPFQRVDNLVLIGLQAISLC